MKAPLHADRRRAAHPSSLIPHPFFFLALLLLASCTPHEQKHPNVLLISLDQQDEIALGRILKPFEVVEGEVLDYFCERDFQEVTLPGRFLCNVRRRGKRGVLCRIDCPYR